MSISPIVEFVACAGRSAATNASSLTTSPRTRARVQKATAFTLTITTLVWALGIPLGVLVKARVARAADLSGSLSLAPSNPAASASNVTYTARFTTATASSANLRSVYVDFGANSFTIPASPTGCSVTIGGTPIPGTVCNGSGNLVGASLATDNSAPGLTVAAGAIITLSFGNITNPTSGAKTVTVGTDDVIAGPGITTSPIDSSTFTLGIGSAPTLSGGGPPDGQSGVPDEAHIEINASANLTASGATSPVYAENSVPVNVSVHECAGATDATTCASPLTAANRCSTVTIENSTKIRCNLVSGTRLALSTTYVLRVSNRITNTSNVGFGKFTRTIDTTYSSARCTTEGGVVSGSNCTELDFFSRIFRTGSVSAGINTTAPKVQSHTPESGALSVPPNSQLTFTFPTGPEGNMKSGTGTNDVDSHKAIRIKTMTNGVLGSTDLCGASGCMLTWNSATRTLTVTTTLAPSTQYDVCLVGGSTATSTDEAVKNIAGVTLSGDACSSFTTGSSADTTKPALATTNPLDPANGASNVDRFRPDVRITASEAISPSTATVSNIHLYIDTNSNSVKDGAETALGTSDLTIATDPDGKSVRLGMKAALAASTRYCYEITTGLTDVAGNALAATSQANCFTTGSQTDSAAPTLLYFDADSSKAVAGFSEGVTNTSATNAANYTLTCGSTTITDLTMPLTGKTITYFPDRREIEIEGLGLTVDQTCRLTIGTGITDLAGNAFSTAGDDEFEDAKVLNSTTTGGFLGTAGITQDFHTATNFVTFWESPQRCEPRTRITNKSSPVECEFKAPASLASGSTMTLTFPDGFTFSDGAGNARAVPASSSWMNSDLNGPAAGAPVIASVTCTAASRTCIVTTGTATIASGDMIRFELDRITTPTVEALDKRITVIVKDASGVKQGETINPAPFNIATAGARSISGKVCKSTTADGDCADGAVVDVPIASMKVFCDQMGGFVVGTTSAVFAGHQETTTDANGDWTISGLSDGQYGCGLPPDPTTLGDIMGGNSWKNISVSGGNATNVDFDFTNLTSAGQSLAVTLTGAAALASKQVDVYCSAGASDFQFSAPVMKVVTLNGSGNGTATMKLLGGKTYDCGVMPHMDFSAFSGGGPPPTPTFDFLPPRSQRVNVVAGTDPAGVTFVLTAASNTITVNVCDGGTNDASICGTAGKGTGIANVYVNAAPLGCFNATTGEFTQCFGGFSQTNSSGIATLKVTPGAYEIMANGPGLPPGDPVQVDVLTDGTVKQNGATVTQVTIKLAKSSTTISGQILDESGNGIQYAHVNGEKITAGGTCSSFTPNGGWRDSPTDSSGNYTLYVGNGTWNVRAYAPSYGEVGCTTVVVSGASATGKNIQATAGDFGMITGTCPDGAFVNGFGTSGGNFAQCSEGTYSMKVKTGTYTVECFAHGSGPCGRSANQSVTSGGTTTVNFGTTITTGTVSITITGITDAFVDLRDSSGNGSGTGQNTSGVYTIKATAGTYTLRGGSPKYGDLCASQSVTVTANTTTTATCTPPANLRTVSGRVTDGTSNVAGATLTLTTSGGKMFSATTGAQGSTNTNVSLTNVPDGSYTLTAKKKGYESAATTATVSGGNLTLSSPVAMTPTSATSGETVTVSTQSGGSAYAGEGRVIATKGSGADAKAVIADIDGTTGQASLDLTNGTWAVKAIGDNGKESSSSTVTVSGGSLSGSAPTLGLDTAITGFTAKSDSGTITPKSGGIISSETASPVSGKAVEVNIPAGALSTTDSSTGKVEIRLDPSVAAIDPGENLNFVGQEGVEITPKDANGNALGDTSLGSNCTIELPYTDADVTAAGVTESSMTVGALNANGEWETFPTTVDTANNVLTAEVTHFSTFGILGAGGSGGSPTVSDTTPPASPSSITSSATDAKVTLTWKDPADTDFSEVEILRNNPPSTAVSATPLARVAKGAQQFIDSAVATATKYFYILRAKDTSGNAKNSGTVEITTSATAAAAPTTGSTAPATTTTTTTVTTPTTAAPTAPGAASVALNAGDLVKSQTATSVYLVGANGKRYVYPNEMTYKTWHADFSRVKKISDADLASLQLGGFVTVRPGTYLLKIESDPKVYAVEAGGALRWVETEARAKKLFGAAWNQHVVDVPVSFWVGYKVGLALGADQHPSGTLVSAAGATYYVDAGKKRMVAADVFAAHGFQQRFVRPLDPSIVYADGPTLIANAVLTFAGTK